MGSGGEEGKPPPEAAGPVNAPWERALRSRNECQRGRCKYANPERKPDSYLGAMGCDGYHASEHIDADGRVTVRWYLCPRHLTWWKAERLRRAALKGA